MKKSVAVLMAVFCLSVHSGFGLSVIDCSHHGEELVACCSGGPVSDAHCSMDMQKEEKPCCIDEELFVQFDFLSAGLVSGLETLNPMVSDVLHGVNCLDHLTSQPVLINSNERINNLALRTIDVQTDLQVFLI